MIGNDIFDRLPLTPFLTAATYIQNGDLLLCSGNSPISQAIKQITKSVFSHVGLMLNLSITKQWLVLESVESIGCRCVTLEEGYLANYMGEGRGYDGKILIARHADLASKMHVLPTLYEKAFSLLGDQYNKQDIFGIATRYALSDVGINEQGDLKGENSYICSEYVYACLKSIDITLPLNPLGFIAPADIANAPQVSSVVQLTC